MSDKRAQTVMELEKLPWAIMPELIPWLKARVTDEVDPPSVEGAANWISFTNGKAVAVIPIIGTITPRSNWFNELFGGASVQTITHQFRAALNDPEVGAILFDVDSGGGQVGGVAELADEIYASRGSKPMVAVANGLAASAAYWLASAADELVVTPSGEVGSIGVFAVHQDISAALEKEGINVTLISAGKFKTEFSPFAPLTDEALAAAQERVDFFYSRFTEAVAWQRNVTQAEVINGFGQGRVVNADQAVQMGMADRVATFQEVITGLMASDRHKQDDDKRKRRMRALSR